jgi:putative membrane protein
MVFGFTSPIPGISGGSLAVFANVYDEFFLSASWETLKKNLAFIGTFAVGTAGGLYAASHIITYLMKHHEQVLLFSFIGLILGCIPAIYMKVRVGRISFSNVVIFLSAFAFIIFLAYLGGGEEGTNRTLEELGGITPGLLGRVFAVSFISSIAILIPGLGGSIMMLAFGVYAVYTESISTRNPVMIAVLAVSMLLGILVGIKLIKKILIAAPQKLYSAILGLMLGAPLCIYSYMDSDFTMGLTGVLSIAFALGFSGLAYWMSRRGN